MILAVHTRDQASGDDDARVQRLLPRADVGMLIELIRASRGMLSARKRDKIRDRITSG